MTISKALKKLYTAMCGGTAKKNTAGDLINEIADNYTGGGGGGGVTVDPELSDSSENPVQNKAINAAIAELQAAIEAVNNDYKVTFTIDGETLTADKSVADINAAAAADKNVYAVAEIITGTYQRFIIHQYDTNLVEFYAVQVDENEGVETAKPVCVKGLHIQGADTWTIID